MNETDLIVVGAGSAGCVMASRLADQHGFRVTLVEPPSGEAPDIDRQRPARWLNLLGSADDWSLRTQSIHGLARRQINWPRGRGLGGSCRINAMIWFPPTEYDLRALVAASNFAPPSMGKIVHQGMTLRVMFKPSICCILVQVVPSNTSTSPVDGANERN